MILSSFLHKPGARKLCGREMIRVANRYTPLVRKPTRRGVAVPATPKKNPEEATAPIVLTQKELPTSNDLIANTATKPPTGNDLVNASTTTSNEPGDPTPPETETPKPVAEDPPLANPFHLLAHATENIDLSSRLRSYSNNLSIVGALWCTLSITALTMAPIDDVYKETRRMENTTAKTEGGHTVIIQRRQTSINMPPPDHRKRQPVLVKYFGIPEQYLEDIYMACWSASFFTSAIGLGLSTVVTGIVAATAPAFVKLFVRRHSDVLLAMPFCQALSSGFGAVGLTVGLDEARGEPVSWIGYIGTIAGAVILGGSTRKVLRGYKAARTSGRLNVSLPKDN